MDYHSKRWKAKRQKILRRDKYQCQVSKRYGKAVEADLVHHIFPAKDYPEYEWEDWNLISVSQATHNKLHNTNTDELSSTGLELLKRTARKHDIKID